MNENISAESVAFEKILEEIRVRLKEDRIFLQENENDNDSDDCSVKRERIRNILYLADLIEKVLEQCIQKGKRETDSTENAETVTELKSHILGIPDGETNIEADWRIDDDLPYSGDGAVLKRQEGKKHKKKKEKKKNKRNKKGKKGSSPKERKKIFDHITAFE